MVQIIYEDTALVICIKPAGVRSTDEPGGMPELVRQTLGITQVRTVHRLDQVVGGLMVLAKTPEAASELSRQIREGGFQKEYLAVVHGTLPEPAGTFRDLLVRNKAERKTYVTHTPGKDVQEAVLDYTVLGEADGLTKVRIVLHTGRTHQIRCQFSSRSLPLVGDRKYSLLEDGCPIALWSARLCFRHPDTGAVVDVTMPPPELDPWVRFRSND